MSRERRYAVVSVQHGQRHVIDTTRSYSAAKKMRMRVECRMRFGDMAKVPVKIVCCE